MGKNYSHLGLKEREQIYVGLQSGHSINDIAMITGYSRSTLFRELKRNRDDILGYLPDRAQERGESRRTKSFKIDQDPSLKDYIINQLKEGWSPQSICGRLKLEQGMSVISHETIYAYIYHPQTQEDALHVYLRRQKSHRGRRYRPFKRSSIPSRVSIHHRPFSVEKREVFGDWEADLMMFSAQKDNLLTLRERKSRFVMAIQNPSKKADSTANNLIQAFKGKKKVLALTMTYDNGGEFARHERVAQALRIDTFFCDPYASWQKGSVENGNAQLRLFFPRSTILANLSQKDIDLAVNKINNRPMKCLGFRTPAEVFTEHAKELIN